MNDNQVRSMPFKLYLNGTCPVTFIKGGQFLQHVLCTSRKCKNIWNLSVPTQFDVVGFLQALSVVDALVLKKQLVYSQPYMACTTAAFPAQNVIKVWTAVTRASVLGAVSKLLEPYT